MTKQSASIWGRLRAWHARVFVERQLILRSKGRVRFLTLSPTLQNGAALAGMGALAWVLVSAVALINADYTIESKDQAIADKTAEAEEARFAYNELVEQVRAYHRRFSEVSSELADSQNKLLGMIGQNSNLRSTLSSASEQLESAEQHVSSVAGELTQKELVLDGLLDQNLLLKSDLETTRAQLETVESQRAKAAERAERLTGELQSLESDLESLAGRNLTLETGLNTLESEVALVTEQRAEALEETEALQNRVAELEARIVSLQRSQQDFLLHMTERTINTIDEAERTIAMTGLNTELLLNRVEDLSFGQGGPFVAISSELLAASELKHEVSVLDSHMERWERLQFVLRILPLTAPVDSYRLSSKFGKRKDPLNGRWAMHYGVDLAGPLRSAVMATSSGTVVFAGWHGNYGRVVEIDHGLGVRTRYGHLKSIDVKKGDKVGFREKIGTLGSSGRSTGPHVHYEIFIDGKSIDPENFLKAGKYVFKG